MQSLLEINVLLILDQLGSMHPEEQVQDHFVLEDYLQVQENSKHIVDKISRAISPGMSQPEAEALANKMLKEAGFEKNWHKTHFRVGTDTLKTFREKSNSELILQEDDIYFLDIGPVQNGYEADFGKTFVLADNSEKLSISQASEKIFNLASKAWSENPMNGKDLYKYTKELADEAGFILKMDVNGHRLGDFPHHVFFRGSLTDFEPIPIPNVWVFEVHLEHKSGKFGAFFEDILRK